MITVVTNDIYYTKKLTWLWERDMATYDHLKTKSDEGPAQGSVGFSFHVLVTDIDRITTCKFHFNEEDNDVALLFKLTWGGK
jgi:hypothetical protein